MAYKGIFKPLNPSKYKGNPTNIIYRSRWELMLMAKFDEHPEILEWSSEEVIIPYKCPTDNRVHRYFPDFWIKKKSSNGTIEEILIEVKPYKETIPPKLQENTSKGTKQNKRYLGEVLKWGKNSAKWNAAEAYCMKRGWTFMKITERELGLTF